MKNEIVMEHLNKMDDKLDSHGERLARIEQHLSDINGWKVKTEKKVDNMNSTIWKISGGIAALSGFAVLLVTKFL
jgi:hypothetical protein